MAGVLTDAHLIRWYAVTNDLIGGWSVATVDRPTSQMSRAEDERVIADFASERDARRIVALHNEDLERRGAA